MYEKENVSPARLQQQQQEQQQPDTFSTPLVASKGDGCSEREKSFIEGIAITPAPLLSIPKSSSKITLKGGAKRVFGTATTNININNSIPSTPMHSSSVSCINTSITEAPPSTPLPNSTKELTLAKSDTMMPPPSTPSLGITSLHSNRFHSTAFKRRNGRDFGQLQLLQPIPEQHVANSTVDDIQMHPAKSNENDIISSSMSTSQQNDRITSNMNSMKELYDPLSSISATSSQQEPRTNDENTSLSNLITAKNTIKINGKIYVRLCQVGQGGTSKVFKVLDIENGEIYAMKKIKMKSNEFSNILSLVKEEISLLESLKGQPSIVQLVASEINYSERLVHIVMEYGEVDLNNVLQKYLKERKQNKNSPNVVTISAKEANFIRMTWMSMLEAVESLHEKRIVHGDLKPANFLFVHGQVKLIDFGIAKTINNDTTNIERVSQIGTLNYMSPEAIVDTNGTISIGGSDENGSGIMKVGRPSDVWSMGCILYQMCYGKTPFADIKNILVKINAIATPNFNIEYLSLDPPDPPLIETIKLCLERDPRKRPTVAELLAHPYLDPRIRYQS